MVQDISYNTVVYKNRGADLLTVGSGGKVQTESGGSLRTPVVIIGIPSVSQAAAPLSVVNLPFSHGIVILSAASNIQSASFWLTSVSYGADILLILRGDAVGGFANASTQVDVSTSGCRLLDSLGGAISGFEMHTSLTSDCWVHLKSFTDGIWSIVAQGGDIDG